LYRLIRLIRMAKLVRIAIKIFNESLEDFDITSSQIRLVKIVFVLVFSVHFVACAWFFLSDYFDHPRGSWVEANGFIDHSPKQKYVISVYWSVQTVTTVGFGDICAK